MVGLKYNPALTQSLQNTLMIMEKVECICSVSDFLGKLNSIEEDRCYYRGVENSNFDLIPKLSRPNTHELLSRKYGFTRPHELQHRLLQRFQRYTSHFAIDSSILPRNYGEWLCIAQHHGLPTLLLDWTLNPLVGLYFACSELSDKYGKVWCLTLKEKRERERETIHFEKEEDIEVKEQTSPLIIVPRILTRRIETQAARFTYTTDSTPIDQRAVEPHFPWEKPIESWLVPPNCKAKIKQELRVLRIHHGSLYADLDGYAKYLAEGGL